MYQDGDVGSSFGTYYVYNSYGRICSTLFQNYRILWLKSPYTNYLGTYDAWRVGSDGDLIGSFSVDGSYGKLLKHL